MIYAKGALAAAAAVGRVDGEAVRLRGDGSVVAVNRFVALAVGPLSAEARARVPLEEAALGVGAARMEPGVVGEVAREVARDKRFGGLLEHTEWRCGAEEGRVEVEGTDGVRRRTQVLRRLPDREDDSASVLRAVYGVVGTGLVLNRKRLRAALDALDAAAPDTTGEAPVWVETQGEGVLLRSVDYRTGQRVAARVQAYRGEAGKWLDRDEWERAWGRKIAFVKKANST